MFESILLGILQGLTEFLPVSSSGHLVLARELLAGFHGPTKAFIVLLHGGTLAAVFLYFHQDLFQIVRDSTRPSEGGLRLPILLIVGSIPVAIVGVFISDMITPPFSSPRVAASGLLLTGFVLLAARRLSRGGVSSIAHLTIPGALIIGLAQAFAIVPGISRSGATIVVGMFLGLRGREAARFSFLLSIPAVAGALLLESGVLFNGGLPLPYMAGALSAALVGWASIAFLLKLLDRGNLAPFGVYCLALGSLSLVFLV